VKDTIYWVNLYKVTINKEGLKIIGKGKLKIIVVSLN
jgi:hypothetical protein